MDISVIPPGLHKVPVSELLDYIVRHMIDWSREQGWCGARLPRRATLARLPVVHTVSYYLHIRIDMPSLTHTGCWLLAS